jgi:hypothetical protein
MSMIYVISITMTVHQGHVHVLMRFGTFNMQNSVGIWQTFI